MAEVFLGWMNSVGGLRRKVAIKRILPELAQKQSHLFSQMFADEARLAFQLEHDNIVRVYDVGQSANTYFIVMEYVDGLDLKRIYEDTATTGEKLDMADVVQIALHVCTGLSYAHNLLDDEGNRINLVHNDISPPNIMIGRHGEVKIADFGLSDASVHSAESNDRTVKGKFAYISPEGTTDPTKVSNRSDIFSLGIVMWELLTGRRLFQRDTDIDTFYAVQAAKVPDIRKFRSEVPSPLVEVVNRALVADPDKRYQTCDAMFGDLIQVSYNCRLPVNRFSLVALVNRLRGGVAPSEIPGKMIDSNELNNIMAEMDGMLPPSVAQELQGFVIGAKVHDDVDLLGGHEVRDDWMSDVVEEAGLSEEGHWAEEDKLTDLSEEDPTVIDNSISNSMATQVSLSSIRRPTGIYGTPHIEGVPRELVLAVERAQDPETDLRSVWTTVAQEISRLKRVGIVWGGLVGAMVGIGLGYVLAFIIGA